jgi:hypothetical protein
MRLNSTHTSNAKPQLASVRFVSCPDANPLRAPNKKLQISMEVFLHYVIGRSINGKVS